MNENSQQQLLNIFNSHKPVMICSADGRAVFMNGNAEADIFGDTNTEGIKSYISSTDKIKFDFAMKSNMPQPFIAAAKNIHTYSHLCIIPCDMGDKRFAVVIAAESSGSANSLLEFTSVDNKNILHKMVEILAESDASTPNLDEPLVNIAEAAARLAVGISSPGKLSVELQADISDASVANICTDIGMYAFINIFVTAASIMSELSSDGRILLSIIPHQSFTEITMETEADLKEGKTPHNRIFDSSTSLKNKLMLCEYMAGCIGTSVHTDCSLDKARLSFYTSNINQFVDFKSQMRFEGFEDMLKNSLESVDSIYKEADPA